MTGATRRIAVTGIGLCTPLGRTSDETWDAILAGRSAIAPFTDLPDGARGCRAAAVATAATEAPPLRVAKRAKYAGRAVTCALHALGEAMRHAAVGPPWPDPCRVAVHGATGQTGLDVEEFFPALSAAWGRGEARAFAPLGGPASRLVDPHFSLRTLSNGGLALVAAEAGAAGPSANYVQSECASAHALRAAGRDLGGDRADVALVFACDSLLHPSTWLAFDAMALLSHQPGDRALRPFDRERDGLVLGEGAAVLVLETEEHAAARGAAPVAELAGLWLDRDAPFEDPTRADVLRALLAEAVAPRPAALLPHAGHGIDRSKVGFLVARGLGTRAHDAREAAALDAGGAGSLPVTAFKGATGYLGAATGLVEAAIGIRALAAGVVPPVAHLDTPDPDVALRLAQHPAALAGGATLVLTVSAGWSGEWALMAFARPGTIG
jgi:3-oxoacyl-[acyl-carrier-protein] synthase II